jgi:hypothetical protein
MTFDQQPLGPNSPGWSSNIAWCSSTAATRQARSELAFDVGQGTQDLGFRNELNMLFECRRRWKCAGRDRRRRQADDRQLRVSRQRGRVYPGPLARLAPDFFFHDQIYRQQRREVLLPPGEYKVTYTRGPEYRVSEEGHHVPAQGRRTSESFRLKRWIKLADRRLVLGRSSRPRRRLRPLRSADRGRHAGGDMMRHILGEDLNVGCVLSWGPCWYFPEAVLRRRRSTSSRRPTT